jgi:hypothetical protein
MSTLPPNDEPPPVRRPTPDEERKGVRTVGLILLGFFAFLAAMIIGLAAIR